MTSWHVGSQTKSGASRGAGQQRRGRRDVPHALSFAACIVSCAALKVRILDLTWLPRIGC